MFVVLGMGCEMIQIKFMGIIDVAVWNIPFLGKFKYLWAADDGAREPRRVKFIPLNLLERQLLVSLLPIWPNSR
jgi:hypothetical protein